MRTRVDAYRPAGELLYECPGCGRRTRSEGHVGRCRDCGRDMQNIAVPRE